MTRSRWGDEVAEGGRLQRDGVGHGRPHSRLPLKRVGRPTAWLGAGRPQCRCSGPPAVRCSGQGLEPRSRSSHGLLRPCPLLPRDPGVQPGLRRRWGSAQLTSTSIRRMSMDRTVVKTASEGRSQTPGPRRQKGKLLEKKEMRGNCDLRAQHWRTSSLPTAAAAPRGTSKPWPVGPDHCTPNSWHPGRCRAASCQAQRGGEMLEL